MKSLIISSIIATANPALAVVELAKEPAAEPQQIQVARNDWVLPAIAVGVIGGMAVSAITDPKPPQPNGPGYYYSPVPVAPGQPAPRQYYGAQQFPYSNCYQVPPHYENGALIVNQVICY